MAQVFLPYELRSYTGGKGQIEVPGETLGALVGNLESAYPGITEHILEDGRLKPGLAAVVGTCRDASGHVATVGAGHRGALRASDLWRMMSCANLDIPNIGRWWR